jgi:hypothetical protein
MVGCVPWRVTGWVPGCGMVVEVGICPFWCARLLVGERSHMAGSRVVSYRCEGLVVLRTLLTVRVG